MSSVAVHQNLSTFIDAIAAEDSQALATAAREFIARAEDTSELIGQIGLIAMHGDSDGHAVLTLAAASMISRWLIALRHVLGNDAEDIDKGIPLIVQTLLATAPAVRAGRDITVDLEPIFPSGLPEGETVASALGKAIAAGDTATVEHVLAGLYGTGADYRTISIRIYDAISQTFQEGGHALQDAVRGSQVLDAVEWSDYAQHYIHWISPHLPEREEEPNWVEVVRGFLDEPQHSLASYRTRLAAPQNANALPLRALLLSDATTPKICQGVYDALIKNGASSRAIGSVIALAASDLLQSVVEEEHELFVQAAHGLLYASAARVACAQVQEVEVLPLLFTAAAYLNALARDLAEQTGGTKAPQPGMVGGGLIAPALLESLATQIEERNVSGALATARRSIQMGHDPRALFGVIGLSAAQADAAADQGHALQIVQAAGEEYLAWPEELARTNIDGFLQAALRAAALAQRNTPASA